MLGVVRYLVERRHFGKIAADKRTYFFHYDDLDGLDPADVEVGLWIEFAPCEGPRGPRALRVRRCEMPAPARRAR